MEKLIITAALTGGVTMPTQTPYLPLTPEEIATEAIRGRLMLALPQSIPMPVTQRMAG